MPDSQDDLSPGKKDPAEGARGANRGGDPAPAEGATPGHLGPAGDPVEGKDPSDA